MLVIKLDVLQHVIIRRNILVKNDKLLFLNLLLYFFLQENKYQAIITSKCTDKQTIYLRIFYKV